MNTFAKIAWAISIATLNFGVWMFPLRVLMVPVAVRKLRS